MLVHGDTIPVECDLKSLVLIFELKIACIVAQLCADQARVSLFLFTEFFRRNCHNTAKPLEYRKMNPFTQLPSLL